jgi:hypothetical protein
VRTRRSRLGPRGLLVILAVLGALGGCGDDGDDGDDEGESTTTSVATNDPITLDQAELLSGALFRNGELGGADLAGDLRFGGNQLQLEGVVDWPDGMATGRITGHDARGAPVDLTFFVAGQTILFAVPTEERARLEAEGHLDPQWVSRPFVPDVLTLDRALQILGVLASTQPDNPTLLQQQGILDLGRDDVEGRAASVFQAPNSTYWVADDGTLLRVEARLSGVADPFIVVLGEHGERNLPAQLPDPVTVVDGTQLTPEEFARVSGAGDIGTPPAASSTSSSALTPTTE